MLTSRQILWLVGVLTPENTIAIALVENYTARVNPDAKQQKVPDRVGGTGEGLRGTINQPLELQYMQLVLYC